MGVLEAYMNWAALQAILVVAALPVAVISAAPGAFQEETRSCHPDCTKYGNCNGETGQCDCPFGLAGPTCTDRLFPACHSTKDHGSLPHYGTLYPKNCDCVKQLGEHPYSCPNYLHYVEGANSMTQALIGNAPCLYNIVMEENLLCYRYKDRPAAEQLSDSPDIKNSNVQWFRVKAYPTWTEATLSGDKVPKEQIKMPDGGTLRPLRNCPKGCNGRGWCQAGGSTRMGDIRKSDRPWCKCHPFFSGETCEVAEIHHCYRNCSGVGTCVAGWCHCQPGYWGHGCTRTKAYTSSVGWRPNHAEVKVYVYDLPNVVVHRNGPDDDWSTIDLMYNAELEFTEKLLGDWSVRTENPWEAALFYVPMFTTSYTGNARQPSYIMQHVIHYLQQSSPFFNLTEGRNHVMWATNDRGVCSLQHAPTEMQYPIKLVHFGQAPRRPYRTKGHIPLGGWSGGLPVVEALPRTGHRFEGFPEFKASDVMHEHEVCIRPEKDVVAPSCLHNAWLEPAVYQKVWDTTFTPDGELAAKRRPNDLLSRTTTLFFDGYTTEDAAYSQGVRHAISRMFGLGGKHDPTGASARADYRALWPESNAVEEMQKAKFCLAPMGAGWGIRLAEAMVTGCVPVIIQDHVYQPLWDVLPFEEFSIRLSRTDVANMVNILDDVTPDQLAKLQAGVERYQRAFIWRPDLGGLAYNYTVVALRRRALSLWSANYHRRSHRRGQRRR